MRIDELLEGACERLSSLSDTAKLDAQLLLAHVLDVSTSYFYTWPEREVNTEALASFEKLVVRREKGEPVAYLVGQQAFWTLDLEVAPCTLIPRADTEKLVEVALLRLDLNRPMRVLDLGTGTGAIALAIASECPHATVIGVDFLQDAVALARRNAQRNRITNVEFIQSSWFDALAGHDAFDLIVSNPPYIDPSDEHLSQGDVRFEPKSALVADHHGMADIEHIIQYAPDFMTDKAYLMFEHGYDQAALVRGCFKSAGYSEVQSFQDLGGNDRVTIAQRSSKQ